MNLNLHYYNKYINFINSRKNRIICDGTYLENHHIEPEAFGGSNDPENMILLTAREHYIAHWMLFMAYPGNRSMIFAFIGMNNFHNPKHKRAIYNSKAFSKAKKAWSESLKGRKGTPATQEQKDRLSKLRKNTIRVYHKDFPECEFFVSLEEKNTNPDLIVWNKGKTLSYDSEGNKHFVSTDDTRLKSGELISSGKYVAQNNKGSNNTMFSGYYITPTGRFSTAQEACEAHSCGIDAIRTRCKESHKKITHNSIYRSKDLNMSDHKHYIGKTWKDIGYGFETV